MQSQDLVSYLQHHIAEQKRYDASLSGIQVPAEISQTQPVTKEAAPVSDAIAEEGERSCDRGQEAMPQQELELQQVPPTVPVCC